MRTYRLSAAALPVGGLLAIGDTQIAATPTVHAREPARVILLPDLVVVYE